MSKSTVKLNWSQAGPRLIWNCEETVPKVTAASPENEIEDNLDEVKLKIISTELSDTEIQSKPKQLFHFWKIIN